MSCNQNAVHKRTSQGKPYNFHQASAKNQGCKTAQCAPYKMDLVPMVIAASAIAEISTMNLGVTSRLPNWSAFSFFSDYARLPEGSLRVRPPDDTYSPPQWLSQESPEQLQICPQRVLRQCVSVLIPSSAHSISPSLRSASRQA